MFDENYKDLHQIIMDALAYIWHMGHMHQEFPDIIFEMYCLIGRVYFPEAISLYTLFIFFMFILIPIYVKMKCCYGARFNIFSL